MKKDYYSILGIEKNASEADIKKAYKKLAMQYHPDRNKDDKKAEAKFKEINEAYQTLGDSKKRKNYDQFWSADWNPFGWMGWGNPFGWSGIGGFDFWDIFWGTGRTQWMGGFDFSDFFSQGNTRSNQKTGKQEEVSESLDVVETIEIPFLDFLFDTSVSVKTVYWKHLTLKIKSGTKPGTKFKITGKWRTSHGKTGDMYVIVDAKMPKTIPENIKPMLEAIRYQL